VTDPLVSLLNGDCSPLRDRLSKKLRQGETLTGRCRLTNLTTSQRHEIVALTGSKSKGRSITIDLDEFNQIVTNTGRFESLESLVRLSVAEPIANRKAIRAANQQAWDEAISDVLLRAAGKQRLIDCVVELHRSGQLARMSGGNPQTARSMLRSAMAIMNDLPVDPMPLAIFAANRLGDAHALDRSTRLGGLLARLIAADYSMRYQAKAAGRQRIFAKVGLVTDELSSSALVLNLPVEGDGVTDRMLRDHATAGLPCRMLFRHLRCDPPSFIKPSGAAKLYVCENPSVIAAASDRHGPRCPPLACVEGNPSLASLGLLSQLTAAGYQIHYHGDFDWGGLRIAGRIHGKFGFIPWRYTAADHQVSSHNKRKLKPPLSESPWDPDLAAKIKECGVAVDEESVIDQLLDDLER